MDRQPLTDRLGDRLLAEYGGAAAAYSLRALNGNGDNVVRVRRASDNDEKDFTAEQIELGEMVNWVTEGSATADGFVETWYDQSGNGNDATQSVAGNQPKIVDGGSLVAGGLDFDGANHYLKTEVELIQTDDVLSLYTVSTIDDVSTRSRIIGGSYYNASNDNGGFIFEVKAATVSTGIAAYFDDVVQNQVGLNSVTEASESLFSLTLNGGISGFYINGNLENSRSSTSMKSTVGEGGGGFVIGATTTGTLPFDGKIKEIIVYNSDQSANRTGIETNINNHYDIY